MCGRIEINVCWSVLLAGNATRVEPAVHAVPVAQDEFGFEREVESRGHFDKTDRNLFEGQDLDVPTFLRKNVRVK